MQNLDQIRARNALEALENRTIYREDVSGMPALIISSGLLATAAFVSTGQDARAGMHAAMDEVASHLRLVGKLNEQSTKPNETKGLLDELSQKDSIDLQTATTEALAFLGFLKRFAPAKPQ